MSGVLRLTQNEMIKITRQLSWRIMAIILIAIVIGYPILVNLMAGLNSGYYSVDYEKAAREEPSEILREYYLTKADTQKFFDEKGLTSDNWQYSKFFHQYEHVCETVRGLELIAEEGKSIYEVQQVFYVGASREYDINGNLSENFRYVPYTFDPASGECVYEDSEKEFTVEAAAELLAEVRKEKKYIEEQIDNPFSEYIEQNFHIDFETVKAEYEAAKAQYEKDPSRLRDYDAVRLKYEAVQKLNKALEKLTEFSNELTAAEELTYIRLLNLMDNHINDLPDLYSKLSEKEFNELNNGYGYYFSV